MTERVARPRLSHRFRRAGRAALRDSRGGIALAFSLAVVPLLGCIALAVDLSTWYAARNEIQKIADGAAIASARQLRIGFASEAQLAAVARSYTHSAIQRGASFVADADVAASLSPTRDQVTVTVSTEVAPIFSRFFSPDMFRVAAESTARLSGTLPVCMVGTDPTSGSTVRLRDRAMLTADRCAVYSNSTSSEGLVVDDSARVRAGRICSAGGSSTSGADVLPRPQNDCPRINDPLAHIAGAVSQLGGCSHSGKTNGPLRVRGRTELHPGTYCSGISIESSAPVTFRPGVYVIGGSGLRVERGQIVGENVSLYFEGEDSTFHFGAESSLTFSATREGPLAGILFFEDPDSPPHRNFRISSDDARKLLGTIYLPRGDLIIDSDRPVAGESAYTVIVARRIRLSDNPSLVLNTDYAATDVPVPDGVGPNASIHLSQ